VSVAGELVEAGLPPKRLHDLHAFATLLFARGVHHEIAQELLGHTRSSMTLDLYTASLPEAAHSAEGGTRTPTGFPTRV
jgi:integrase